MASRLRSLPVGAPAYADGSPSGGQMEAIVARLDDETTELFAAQEADLVPRLIGLNVAQVSRALGYWVVRNRPEENEASEPERSLHLSQILEDRWVLDGALDAEGGSVVATALRLAMPERTACANDDVAKSPANRRGDALVDVCRFFLDHQKTHPGARHRPHLNVVVDIEDLLAGRGGRVVEGPQLDGPSLSKAVLRQRRAPGGHVRCLGGARLRHRHPHHPGPLWTALVIRDEGCPFTHCDRPSVWCEAHHVVWVTQGGTTELANLALVCSRHLTSSTNRVGTPGCCPAAGSR